MNRWKVFDHWIDEATICDPTVGEVRFAFALFRQAQERGITVTEEMLSHLCLIERKQSYLDKFLHIIKQEYDLKIPNASIYCCDVILDTPRLSFDILVGNPPWMNFMDLPPDYKKRIKHYFCQAGLVPDRKAVLLGSSRTDIAALVLKITLRQLLRDQGTDHFLFHFHSLREMMHTSGFVIIKHLSPFFQFWRSLNLTRQKYSKI